MLTATQKEFRATEIESRVQSLYRASQLPPGSGLTYYYMCPKNKAKDIVEVAYLAYALLLTNLCNEKQTDTLCEVMLSMFQRGVYMITGTAEQQDHAERLLKSTKNRGSEEECHSSFFGEYPVSAQLLQENEVTL